MIEKQIPQAASAFAAYKQLCGGLRDDSVYIVSQAAVNRPVSIGFYSYPESALALTRKEFNL